MSIAAPLAVVEALLPRGRGRSWLGWFGIAVCPSSAVGVAVLIHVDEDGPDADTLGRDSTPCRWRSPSRWWWPPSRRSAVRSTTVEGRATGSPVVLGLAGVRADGRLRPGARLVGRPGHGLARRGRRGSPAAPLRAVHRGGPRGTWWLSPSAGSSSAPSSGSWCRRRRGATPAASWSRTSSSSLLVLALALLLRARTRERSRSRSRDRHNDAVSERPRPPRRDPTTSSGARRRPAGPTTTSTAT